MFGSLANLALNNPQALGSLVGIVFVVIVAALIYTLAPRANGDPVYFGTGGDVWTYLSSNDDNGVGTIRKNKDGTKSYRWCKILQTASQTIAAGDVLVYTTLGGWDAAVVSSDASADGGAVPIGAGIATTAITAAQGTAGIYGWVQIGGAGTLSNAVTSGAAGKQITASTSDKIAALRANAYDTVLGFMINTTTSIVLQCPGSGF